MRALDAIMYFEEGNKLILKKEEWLKFIVLSKQERLNIERVNQLQSVHFYILNYVKRTLQILERIKSEKGLNERQFSVLEDVLKWSEVAKTGMFHHRMAWIKSGYNLAAHNIGSAQIYEELCNKNNDSAAIRMLIETHGLIGQYIRGELPLKSNFKLLELSETGWCSKEDLELLLLSLNQCIIEAVDLELWENLRDCVKGIIGSILFNQNPVEYTMTERLEKLRNSSIHNGENFNLELQQIFSMHPIEDFLTTLFINLETWYFESALHEFSLEEVLKILCIVAINKGSVSSVSFEPLMMSLYYDRFGAKKINLYKKRMIENYLKNLEFKEIVEGVFQDDSIHVKGSLKQENEMLYFDFEFSGAAEKLIEYCQEAEKSDTQYEKAIILLFDLFGLRKDVYDRFYEEERYLETMNSSIDYKKVILDYIVGDCVVDIGPGGGALMDLIESSKKCKEVIGVDISQNVLDSLNKRKQREKRSWKVLEGDALELSKVFSVGEVSTVIFCSILHELYSYVPFNNRKFNHDTLAVALKSAFRILPIGGRIIIRDGIMTEPKEQYRIIRFLSNDGLAFLKRYQQDFQGRAISVDIIGHNEVKMPVNDAMEFLYTYTWGEDSYVHEINEQFGYFTPTEFEKFIEKHLGVEAFIVKQEHYLQPGYEFYLSHKIEFYDEKRQRVSLPDSTCLIIIEKKVGN